MSSQEKKPTNSILSLFIERPKLGHLVMVLVVIMGLMSLQGLRYEVVPKIDMGIVTVTTTKAGAGPGRGRTFYFSPARRGATQGKRG